MIRMNTVTIHFCKENTQTEHNRRLWGKKCIIGSMKINKKEIEKNKNRGVMNQ